MATRFSSTHLTRHAWGAWCVYMDVRKSRGVLKRRADEWRTIRSVQCVWRKWREAVEAVRQRAAMETLALHHWAHRLTEQVPSSSNNILLL